MRFREEPMGWGSLTSLVTKFAPMNIEQQVVGVCVSQHTQQWCLPDEMSFTGTQPNTYVSRGSYANRLEWRPATGLTSKTGPALAASNDMVWLAFVTNDTAGQLAVYSSPNGQDWDQPSFPGATSTQAPALAFFNNTLYVAFISSGNQVAVWSSADGQSWFGTSQVGTLTSQESPSLTVFNEALWLGCIADDGTNRLLLCSTPDGKQWSTPLVIIPPSSTSS
jgi:hypothetical protein